MNHFSWLMNHFQWYTVGVSLIVSIRLSRFAICASSGLEMASGTGEGAQKYRTAARERPEAILSFW
jgi:hypothetical protein